MKRSAKPGLVAFIGLFLTLSILPSAGKQKTPTNRSVNTNTLALLPQLKNKERGWNKASER